MDEEHFLCVPRLYRMQCARKRVLCLMFFCSRVNCVKVKNKYDQ